MFHLAPLAEAFVRGYFDVFRILLEMGARPQLELDRNIFRSFGHELFLNGEKGRQHFIQLLYDHGEEKKSNEHFDGFVLQVVTSKMNLKFTQFESNPMEFFVTNQN